MYNEQPQFESSDSDNDAAYAPSFHTTLQLRASIATISDTQLRQILVRLVDRSPGFQHAVAKELQVTSPSNAPPHDAAPTAPSSRRKQKPSRRRLTLPSEQSLCVNCGQHYTVAGGDHDSLCVYHPGKLEEDIYEFPSYTPEGRAFQIRRKIVMWSCCDEDVHTPGCASALAHTPPARGRGRGRKGGHTHTHTAHLSSSNTSSQMNDSYHDM